MGNFFSLGSRVCIGILYPAVLALHRLTLSIVTHPPLAVTPQVSTNLDPVARLEGVPIDKHFTLYVQTVEDGA
jgi:hypothetical protein